MQAQLFINGVNFHLWAEEGGIKQSQIYRQSREIVTLNGISYRSNIVKREINFSAVEISDSTLQTLMAALNTNPASVTYTDMKTGGGLTSTFYITDVSVGAKVVTGGNTYYEGFSFNLEER